MDVPIVSQIHLVTPVISSSPGCNYELTNLDLINCSPRPDYLEFVLFFRMASESPTKALSRPCPKHWPSSLFSLAGFATARDLPSSRQCPFSVDFSLYGCGGHADLSQMPLMQVQVTTFGCGGVAIGFRFLHVIMDGYSLVKFLTRWSEIHRGSRRSTPGLRKFAALPRHLDTSYMLPINLRRKGRFAPQIPEDYFGNAFVPCQAYAASAGEVASDKRFAAKLIHAALLPTLHWKRGLASTSLRSPVSSSSPRVEIDRSRGTDVHIWLSKTHKKKLLDNASFTRYFSDRPRVCAGKL
ncbi:hypothetical protein SELMODRAFT_423758 [Selaginella moellendorffii]|uniref:BAHD family acyltransferase, clade V n=1 Tax=Selaginella moellendorffii TaxID=88036 RepID=D8SMS1_SELML|nr:hypothetical protein SELMODRAFT_423758 [Selaginella moellendorffii]